MVKAYPESIEQTLSFLLPTLNGLTDHIHSFHVTLHAVIQTSLLLVVQMITTLASTLLETRLIHLIHNFLQKQKTSGERTKSAQEKKTYTQRKQILIYYT